MEQFIVKCQTPIIANHPNPRALVYNEDRSIQIEIEIDDELLVCMEGQVKRFFWATVVEDDLSHLQIVGDADWQDW